MAIRSQALYFASIFLSISLSACANPRGGTDMPLQGFSIAAKVQSRCMAVIDSRLEPALRPVYERPLDNQFFVYLLQALPEKERQIFRDVAATATQIEAQSQAKNSSVARRKIVGEVDRRFALLELCDQPIAKYSARVFADRLKVILLRNEIDLASRYYSGAGDSEFDEKLLVSLVVAAR
ncbi:MULTISPECIES: hypothetical protein [unclassified Lysobacter]|uniref:hypothetical protein n=2 Tax=Lysobacter TaxID=68 RepID=UPI00307F92C6